MRLKRNKWKEWGYCLTKSGSRKKVKRLTHKADRRIGKEMIKNYERYDYGE